VYNSRGVFTIQGYQGNQWQTGLTRQQGKMAIKTIMAVAFLNSLSAFKIALLPFPPFIALTALYALIDFVHITCE
jgi:hypothetical protein